MADTPTTPVGPAAPPTEEQRQCRKCGETKTVKPETWVYRPDKKKVYHAHGTLCLACEKKRKQEYEARRGLIIAAVAPAEPTEKPDDARKELKAAAKLDVARSLKAGSHVLNDLSAGALARLAEYVEDPEHEMHAWALEFTLQRILPRKLYEELGGEAAGLGALQDKRPVFVVNVHPAAPQIGNTYEHGGDVVDVNVAPAQISKAS